MNVGTFRGNSLREGSILNGLASPLRDSLQASLGVGTPGMASPGDRDIGRGSEEARSVVDLKTTQQREWGKTTRESVKQLTWHPQITNPSDWSSANHLSSRSEKEPKSTHMSRACLDTLLQLRKATKSYCGGIGLDEQLLETGQTLQKPRPIPLR